MKKKFDGKLTLSRETLRTLATKEIANVAGGATNGTCTTSESNTVYTCDSCFGSRIVC